MRIFLSTLLLCISCSIFAVAQIKPTKQETIDWIVAKLRTNGIGYSKDKSLWETTITQDDQIKSVLNLANGSLKMTSVFSLNDICRVTTDDEGITLAMKTPVDTETYSYKYQKFEYSAVDEMYIIIDWTKEPNLRQRMFKALSTLAEYNCPKAKDTF